MCMFRIFEAKWHNWRKSYLIFIIYLYVLRKLNVCNNYRNLLFSQSSHHVLTCWVNEIFMQLNWVFSSTSWQKKVQHFVWFDWQGIRKYLLSYVTRKKSWEKSSKCIFVVKFFRSAKNLGSLGDCLDLLVCSRKQDRKSATLTLVILSIDVVVYQ